VALRILFADDSMTAQNMGKKILTEAGYEVVAVSNGAAALKKIAENKPDIIILDVFMPGYSGLEVCEKVRSSIETLKTPVLLTVGKMEPYKPEDANRVRADGVIIKPFEASDLLAIMKKFEERIAQKPIPPLAEQTIRLERPPDFSQFAVTPAAAPPAKHPEPAPVEHERTSIHPVVDVPDHMATTSAFSDLLGGDTMPMEELASMEAPEAPAPPPSAAHRPTTPGPRLEQPPAFVEMPEADFADASAAFTPIQESEPPAALPNVGPVHVEPARAEAIAGTKTHPELQAVEVEPFEVAPVERTPVEVRPPVAAAPSRPSVLPIEPVAELPSVSAAAPAPVIAPRQPERGAFAAEAVPAAPARRPEAIALPVPVAVPVPKEPTAGEKVVSVKTVEEIAPALPLSPLGPPVKSQPTAQPIPVPVETHSAEPQIVYEEATYELETGRAQPVENLAIQIDPAFEPTLQEPVIEAANRTEPDLLTTMQEHHPWEVSEAKDPNLITEVASIESFPTRFGVETPEDVPVGTASDIPGFDEPEITMPEGVVPEIAIPEVPEATIPGIGISEHQFLEHPGSQDAAVIHVENGLEHLHSERLQSEQPQSEQVYSEQLGAELHEPSVHVPEVPAPIAGQIAPHAGHIEDDFEARVAAAMAAYDQASNADLVEEAAPEQEFVEAFSSEQAPEAAAPETAVSSPAAQPPVFFEYVPPVAARAVAQPAAAATARDNSFAEHEPIPEPSTQFPFVVGSAPAFAEAPLPVEHEAGILAAASQVALPVAALPIMESVRREFAPVQEISKSGHGLAFASAAQVRETQIADAAVHTPSVPTEASHFAELRHESVAESSTIHENSHVPETVLAPVVEIRPSGSQVHLHPIPAVPPTPAIESVAPLAPEAPSAALVESNAIAESLNGQMPAVAAAAASQTDADYERVASVVHRVMERLKPELIAEIVRELNAKR